MRLNIMKQFLLSMAVVVCCLSLAHCTGNECAATQTITSDQDSDCAVDTEDNCPFVYNPNQDDTDEDSFGDACEAPECVNTDTCVGLNYLLQETAYNLRGLYEASTTSNTLAACEGFETLSLQQNDDAVVVINEAGQTLKGSIYSTDPINTIKSAFQNDNTYCQMAFTTTSFNYKIKCYNKISNEFCENTGNRTIVEVSEP